MQKGPQKILIIRFSSIGDIVLTSPVLRCIKKTFPNCELHYLTKSSYQSILKPNPFIDRLILWEGSSTIKELKKCNYEVAIDLHKNLRTSRIKWALRLVKNKVKWLSFDKINIQKWLAVRLKSKTVLPHKHIVHRYLDPALRIGAQFDDKGLDFFIEAHNRVDLSQMKITPYEYYVYAIGGQHETKKLPLTKQVELLSSIKKPILLIGGKEDMERGEELHKLFHHVHNFCGKYNIQQSASIMEQCRKVISHDTGMMHIAAALLKPIISIWGNTIPEFGMSPFYPKNFHDYENRVFQVDTYCRPCSKIGHQQCPWGHFKCMQNQNFDFL